MVTAVRAIPPNHPPWRVDRKATQHAWWMMVSLRAKTFQRFRPAMRTCTFRASGGVPSLRCYPSTLTITNLSGFCTSPAGLWLCGPGGTLQFTPLLPLMLPSGEDRAAFDSFHATDITRYRGILCVLAHGCRFLISPFSGRSLGGTATSAYKRQTSQVDVRNLHWPGQRATATFSRSIRYSTSGLPDRE